MAGGLPTDVVGNQLPNAPRYTFSIGGHYRWALGGDWSSTLRVDGYLQGSDFSTIYNLPTDRLESWSNMNATLTFASLSKGWQVQLWGKNLLNQRVITSAIPASITFGDTTAMSLLDPRTYGLSVTKRF